MDGGLIALEWPANLKRTPTRLRWFEKFTALPANLDLKEVSDRLAEPYATVYRWADTFAYQFPDRRRRGRVSIEQWDNVDWTQRDAHIARLLRISRERVWHSAASPAAVSGPAPHRAVVPQVRSIRPAARGSSARPTGRAGHCDRFSATTFPCKSLAGVLRRLKGVEPHDPASKWRFQVDWRLTETATLPRSGAPAAQIRRQRPRRSASPSARPQWDAAEHADRQRSRITRPPSPPSRGRLPTPQTPSPRLIDAAPVGMA